MFVFFTIATLNLLLGFALAFYLGLRHYATLAPVKPAVPTLVTEAVKDAIDPQAIAAGVREEIQGLNFDTDDTDVLADETSVDDTPIDKASTYDPTADDTLTDEYSLPADNTATPSLHHYDSCINNMQIGVYNYHNILVEARDELHQYVLKPDPKHIEICLKKIESATILFLEKRNSGYNTFQAMEEEKEYLAAIQADLKTIFEQQNNVVKTAREEISTFDYKGNLVDECKKIIDQTSKLISTNHLLRDNLQEASASICRNEDRLSEIAPHARKDSLTGVTNRRGVEACLSEWFHSETEKPQTLSLGLIDVDQFGRVRRRIRLHQGRSASQGHYEINRSGMSGRYPPRACFRQSFPSTHAWARSLRHYCLDGKTVPIHRTKSLSR